MEEIASIIAGPVIKAILGPVTDIWKDYINKSITEAEFQAQIKEHLLAAITAGLQAAYSASTQQFIAFQETLRQSKLLQRCYAYLMVTQITFLTFLELGVPAISKIWGPYPGVGDLDKACMVLIFACLGLGPLVIKPKQPTIPPKV